MNGQVDLQGRALLTVSIRTAPDSATSPVEVWIDTGFTGELWEQECFDRIIRDTDHLCRIVNYIGNNPRVAGISDDKSFRWIDPEWQAAGWAF